MLYILREVFPVYHKWRYYDMTRRETIGKTRCYILTMGFRLSRDDSGICDIWGYYRATGIWDTL